MLTTTRKARPGRSRGSVAAALAIVMLLVVVATALAVISTLNLNMAATEEYNQRALELARSGIDQFLSDMDAGYIDKIVSVAPPSPLELTLDEAFTAPPVVDPNFAQRQLSLMDPSVPNYPIPNTHLPGYVYITFNNTNVPTIGGPTMPWSTWNCDSEFPNNTTAFGGRVVPAFSLDLIATAQVGSYTRHLAVRVTRRWDFAIAAAQQIFLSSSPGYPTYVTGCVYTRNIPGATCQPIIHLGYNYCPCSPNDVGCPTTGTTVRGRLISANPCPSSVQINAGNVALGQRTNYKLIKFPHLNDVAVDGTWEDLTQWTAAHPRADGTFLVPDKKNAGATVANKWYYLDNKNAEKPLILNNDRAFVSGNLSILGGSNSSGIQLTDSVLKIRFGNMLFTKRPTTIYGIKSALSVDENFTFKWGFLQSDPNAGFVIKALRLVSEAGGDFHGLVIVKRGVWLGQLNTCDLTSPCPCVAYHKPKTASTEVALGNCLLAQCCGGGGGCGGGCGGGGCAGGGCAGGGCAGASAGCAGASAGCAGASAGCAGASASGCAAGTGCGAGCAASAAGCCMGASMAAGCVAAGTCACAAAAAGCAAGCPSAAGCSGGCSAAGAGCACGCAVASGVACGVGCAAAGACAAVCGAGTGCAAPAGCAACAAAPAAAGCAGCAAPAAAAGCAAPAAAAGCAAPAAAAGCAAPAAAAGCAGGGCTAPVAAGCAGGGCCGGGGGGGGGGCAAVSCPASAPVCQGAYLLGGTCGGAGFGKACARPPYCPTVSRIPIVQPPGAPGSGSIYPLRITGAILAPYDSDPTQGYALVVKSLAVTWDPTYLKVLHKQAPLNTEAWELEP